MRRVEWWQWILIVLGGSFIVSIAVGKFIKKGMGSK